MMNRNEFLKSSVGLAAALIGIGASSACGSDGGSGPPDAKTNPDGSSSGSDAAVDGAPADMNPGVVSCSMNGTTVAIAANHGHTLVVSKADIAAGVDKMYSIQGTSLHDHLVMVTAAQFAMLAANTSISVQSTVTIHSHAVTISCAAA